MLEQQEGIRVDGLKLYRKKKDAKKDQTGPKDDKRKLAKCNHNN